MGFPVGKNREDAVREKQEEAGLRGGITGLVAAKIYAENHCLVFTQGLFFEV